MRFWATSVFGLAGCLYSTFALKWRRNFLQVKAQPPYCGAYHCDINKPQTPLVDYPASPDSQYPSSPDIYTPDFYDSPSSDSDTPASPELRTCERFARLAENLKKNQIKREKLEFPHLKVIPDYPQSDCDNQSIQHIPDHPDSPELPCIHEYPEIHYPECQPSPHSSDCRIIDDQDSSDDDCRVIYDRLRSKRPRSETVNLSSSSDEDNAEISQPAKRARICTPYPKKSDGSCHQPVMAPKKMSKDATERHMALVRKLQKTEPPEMVTRPTLEWQRYNMGGKIFPHPKFGKRWIIFNKDFIICYDHNTRAPCWVIEEVLSRKLTEIRDIEPRPDREQREIPIDFRTRIWDYDYDGFKPQYVAEYDLHPSFVKDFCVCSNIVAQRTGNEDYGTVWDELRAYVVYLSNRFRSILVLTGPLYLPKRGADGRWTVKYELIGEKRVAVPTHFFKVILCEQQWDHHFRLECYKFENKCKLDPDLRKFVVSRSSLEKDAGFSIFSEVEDKVIAHCDTDRRFATGRYYRPRRLAFEHATTQISDLC